MKGEIYVAFTALCAATNNMRTYTTIIYTTHGSATHCDVGVTVPSHRHYRGLISILLCYNAAVVLMSSGLDIVTKLYHNIYSICGRQINSLMAVCDTNI